MAACGSGGEAVDWLELQAMRSGLLPRDEAVLDRVFSARQARLAAASSRLEESRELASLVADFQGLRDVTAFAARAQQLPHDKAVKQAAKQERAEEES